MIPWRRKGQSTPVILPGKSQGQRSLAGYSPWGHKESDTTLRLNNIDNPSSNYLWLRKQHGSRWIYTGFWIHTFIWERYERRDNMSLWRSHSIVFSTNKQEGVGLLPLIPSCDHYTHNLKRKLGDFPGGPAVKTSPSHAGCAGSIPSQEVNIPHAPWQKKKSP